MEKTTEDEMETIGPCNKVMAMYEVYDGLWLRHIRQSHGKVENELEQMEKDSGRSSFQGCMVACGSVHY